MRLPLYLLLLALCLQSAARADDAGVAPDWSLVSAEGETVRLSEEADAQPVILFFWATWCPYCKALMPHLHSMRLEYGDRIKILAINFRETGDPVAFIQDAGYDFVVLPEGDAVAAKYAVFATPGILLVDRQGDIRFDLRALARRDLPATEKSMSHGRKAAYRAPYWAAEIRKSIDLVLAESRP
jgi:cytochrome c biogenesis protein CcmG/thiol:disulfide interchange protein DsbE